MLYKTDVASGFKAHKDDEHEGDDDNTKRETSDAAVNVTVQRIVTFKSQTQQSTHVSPSGHTRTLVQERKEPMKGVIITEDVISTARSSLNLPSISVTDKGKRVLEGPPEVEEKSFSKSDEQTAVPSGSEIVDTKLGIFDEVEKEEDGTELVQRKRKSISEGTTVVVTSPDKRQSSKDI